MTEDRPSLEARDEGTVSEVAALTNALARRWFQAEIRHLDRIPEGAALLVGNHNAGLMAPECLLLGAALYEEGGLDAVPFALAGDSVVSAPVIGELASSLGIVRACRENAHLLLDRGKRVLVYPGGDLEAMRPFRRRHEIVFGGRRGYIRTALRQGVSIVPVVAAGAHSSFIVLDDGRWLAEALHAPELLRVGTWPITLCLPWGLVVGPGLFYLPLPSRILIEVLEPVTFERTGAEAASDPVYVDACAQQVEARMQDALTRLARERVERRRIRPALERLGRHLSAVTRGGRGPSRAA